MQCAIAIGQDAAVYARSLNVRVESIRHPSYGGIREFRSGLATLYDIDPLCFNHQTELQLSQLEKN